MTWVEKLLASSKALLPSGPTQEELNIRLGAAVEADDVAAIQSAVKAGADVNADVHTTKPLSRAALKCHLAATKVLLTAGATIDESDALFYAAEYGRIDVMKELLEAGATVDLSTTGPTPLYMASCHDQLEAAKLLLAAGADPHLIVSMNKETPVEIARQRQHTELADYLQSVMDDPATRPSAEQVGLHIEKRAAALTGLGKPLGPIMETELKYHAQRQAREMQRQEALRGGGI